MTRPGMTARDHLTEGHTVSAWWKVDQRGALTLADDGVIDIYDTELGDAEPTDQVYCETCNRDLDLTDDVP